MSTTVALGGMTVTSTTDSASEISEALAPQESESPKPRVLVDKGQPVEEEPEKDGISKAASELGKKGGEAAAKARKAAEKEKPKETADEEPDEGEEAKRKLAEEIASTPDPEQKKKLASDRVLEATRAAAAAKREAAEARREAAEVRARLEAAERAVQAPREPQAASDGQPARGPDPYNGGPEEDPEPQENDYERHSDFVRATARWAYRQEARADQERQQTQRALDTHIQGTVRRIDTFRAKVNESISAAPELLDRVIPFDDVVRNSSYMVPPGQRCSAFNVLNDEILTSERPAELMAHLRENPEVVRGLLALPDREAITRKMAKIEERLEGAPLGTPPPQREVSKAKPPVRPVTGSPHTADQELDENAPLSSFVRAFGQRELKARSR